MQFLHRAIIAIGYFELQLNAGRLCHCRIAVVFALLEQLRSQLHEI